MAEVLEELQHFFKVMNLQKSYDFVIPVERKGTALIRILLESNNGSSLNLDTDKIVSSEAVEYLDHDMLSGKRVWLFDDTVFTGSHIRERFNQISEMGAKVETSAFAVHQKTEFSPQHKYYDGLSFRNYSFIRSEIIRLISKSEKLLLDTEHIGIRINHQEKPQKLIEKLNVLGRILFVNRPEHTDSIFVSIHGPDFFKSSFPMIEGNNVKPYYKLRFLINQNYFWMVPMVYWPSPVGEGYKMCPTFENTGSRDICICPEDKKLDINSFYCRNLYWSSLLLVESLKHLSEIIDVEYDATSPKYFPIENLKVLFPTLNIEAWKSSIIEKLSSVENNLQNSTEPKSLVNRNKNVPFDDQTDHVIREIINILTERYEENEYRLELANRPRTWSRNEDLSLDFEHIFNYFNVSGVPGYKVSQALDVLIDQAVVVPTTIKKRISDKDYWVRGARLDGEYTYNWTRLIRHEFSGEGNYHL